MRNSIRPYNVKACGPPNCFKTVEPLPPKKNQPPTRSILKKASSQPAVTNEDVLMKVRAMAASTGNSSKFEVIGSKGRVLPTVVTTKDSMPLVIIDSSSSDENVPTLTLAGKKAAQAAAYEAQLEGHKRIAEQWRKNREKREQGLNQFAAQRAQKNCTCHNALTCEYCQQFEI